MGDKNPIRTLGDYSNPSHEGYGNTIELPVGNNVNDLRDFAKPVKAITLPQDVPSTSDRCLIELENQVQRLMEAHLAPTIAWKILNKPSLNMHPRVLTKRENKEEEKVSPKNIDVDPSTPPDPSVSFITEKVLKLNSFFESLGLVPQLPSTKLVCTKGDDGDVMFIEIVKKYDDSHEEEPEAGEHENPIITEGCPSNLKIPCNIRHVHVEIAYIDPNSPLNIMTRMMYNWIMRRKLDPRENSNRGVSNFTGRINGMHVFVGNFTYIVDFMIVEDISSIIDPRLSQVVLGKPFVEISNMTHDLPKGVVRFINGTDEVAYKMPHKIEQYNSLSDLEKEHTKSVYLRNEEDKRRGVKYVMSKILGFYKECLELGPEYVTGMDDEGEVTLYLTRRSLEVLRKFHLTILGGRFNQKAHLLEDKQIPSVGVFDEVFLTLEWHLEEIHVTLTHLEKKQTRLRTCIKIHQEVLFSERGDGVTGKKRRHRDLSGDVVWILATTSQRSRLKVDLEPSTWRRLQKHQATPSRRYAYIYKTIFRVSVCNFWDNFV
ncbi:hypothetical protein Tco_0080447 [Tanacetum coccineum]